MPGLSGENGGIARGSRPWGVWSILAGTEEVLAAAHPVLGLARILVPGAQGQVVVDCELDGERLARALSGRKSHLAGRPATERIVIRLARFSR